MASSLVKVPSKEELSPASLSLSGAHAANKHLFVLLDGTFPFPSSKMNTFPCPSLDFRAKGKELSERQNQSFLNGCAK